MNYLAQMLPILVIAQGWFFIYQHGRYREIKKLCSGSEKGAGPVRL